MFERSQEQGRTFIGHEYDEVIELPDLIDVQLSSYEKFLQREALVSGGELNKQGLEEVFQSIFRIESSNGELVFDYE